MTQITTTAELEALPEKTPVRDRFGDVGVIQARRVHYPETAPQTFEQTIKKYGPLTALPAPTVKPEWDEIYAIVRDLVRDKGNVVYEWPDDEAAVYRDNDGTVHEGMGAVEDLRAEKGTRAVLAILHGKTDREVRADERSKIARSLRNMRTTDDGKPVGAFLNVADWLDTLDDISPAVGQNQDVTAKVAPSAI